MAPPPWTDLTFSLGVEDGMAVRQMIENGVSARIEIQLDVEARDGLHTQNSYNFV